MGQELTAAPWNGSLSKAPEQSGGNHAGRR